MPPRLTARSTAGRLALSLLAALLLGASLAPAAAAEGTIPVPPGGPAAASRLSATDPLNGGYLIVNMHGMLFHPAVSDITEDVAYARWLGSGVIRVFATDSTGVQDWDGKRLGNRIAEIAPALRNANVKLIVALVNNHSAVPGELQTSSGWMDNYWQLLLPFYTDSWRGAYTQFTTDLVSTVQARGARDVVLAWELGNELHTPQQPEEVMSFITSAAALVRGLDPVTPILPGTMGANHLEPGSHASSIARWLYCDAPVDAYTLHAYDWVSRQRPGDMPIDWDLDNITPYPCPSGRTLPVIVEELGTSRALPGVYTADDERGRLQQELRQIEFVRQFPQVVGFGVWNGESPRLADRTYYDYRRGLTSYGSGARGGGSCYDPQPDPGPGLRCQLEQTLRGLRFVRVDSSNQWTSSLDGTVATPLVGRINTILTDSVANALTVSGWVLDPLENTLAGVSSVDLLVGGTPMSTTRPFAVQPTAPAAPQPPLGDDQQRTAAGFQLSVPLARLAAGQTTMTVVARAPQRGDWSTTLQVIVPTLGGVPELKPVLPVVPIVPAPALPASNPDRPAEVQAPQPGDAVSRTFVVQVLAPSADHVDVFLAPGRDRGGKLVGAAGTPIGSSTPLKATVSVPAGLQTLFVHVHSITGKEEILTLAVQAG